MLKITLEKTTLHTHEATLVHIDSEAIKAVLCSRGASILRLETADQNGQFDNIVLGYRDWNDYYENPKYLGASTGPYAGRIYPPRLDVNGETVELEVNFQNYAHLHGGKRSLARADFTVEVNENQVIFSHIPVEAAYPGHSVFRAIYQFEDATMTLTYETEATQDTYTNLTQHAYFNLSGSATRNVLDHTLTLPAQTVGKIDAHFIAESLEPVEDTVFDFRIAKPLRGAVIPLKDTPQMGLDHPFVLEGGPIVLADLASGRHMRVDTDQDCVVVYSHNFIVDQPLDTPLLERQHLGICLECQHFPNDIHFFETPQSRQLKNTCHRQTTRYTFY